MRVAPPFGTQYSGFFYGTVKGLMFIKKHNKRDIQSQITLTFPRACFTCAFWGHLYKLKN